MARRSTSNVLSRPKVEGRSSANTNKLTCQDEVSHYSVAVSIQAKEAAQQRLGGDSNEGEAHEMLCEHSIGDLNTKRDGAFRVSLNDPITKNARRALRYIMKLKIKNII